MLYEYLIKNYIPGEPIFTGDIQIPGMTEENLRYHLKKYADSVPIETRTSILGLFDFIA